jgi:hypothetical protein
MPTTPRIPAAVIFEPAPTATKEAAMPSASITTLKDAKLPALVIVLNATLAPSKLPHEIRSNMGSQNPDKPNTTAANHHTTK